jgi:hypothetical protein
MPSIPWGKNAFLGAAGGAALGGLYGAFSDNTSVLGGALTGAAIGGAAGIGYSAWKGRGVAAAASRFSNLAASANGPLPVAKDIIANKAKFSLIADAGEGRNMARRGMKHGIRAMIPGGGPMLRANRAVGGGISTGVVDRTAMKMNQFDMADAAARDAAVNARFGKVYDNIASQYGTRPRRLHPLRAMPLEGTLSGPRAPGVISRIKGNR